MQSQRGGDVALGNSLIPRYHTIADFRKRHAAQIREVFKQFVVLMCRWKLIGRKTIAVDSTKYWAQNSKKNNYNEAKIQRQLDCIDQKVSEYLQEMNELEGKEKKKHGRCKQAQGTGPGQRKDEGARGASTWSYKSNSKAVAIPRSPPWIRMSRSLVIKTDTTLKWRIVLEVACDDKNNLIVHFDVTWVKMTAGALHRTALLAKENIGMNSEDKITALADKGYFNLGTTPRLQGTEDYYLCAPTSWANHT